MDASRRHSAAEWLVAACGVWHIGRGHYFILLRPPLLPEDVRFIGADLVGVPFLESALTAMGLHASGLTGATREVHRPAAASLQSSP